VLTALIHSYAHKSWRCHCRRRCHAAAAATTLPPPPPLLRAAAATRSTDQAGGKMVLQEEIDKMHADIAMMEQFLRKYGAAPLTSVGHLKELMVMLTERPEVLQQAVFVEILNRHEGKEEFVFKLLKVRDAAAEAAAAPAVGVAAAEAAAVSGGGCAGGGGARGSRRRHEQGHQAPL
jgi:hypothetical protein